MTPDRWVLHIPVLSTAHVPGPDALDELALIADASAISSDGTIRFYRLDVFQSYMSQLWLKPIVDWIKTKIPIQGPARWIRFDMDGDVIPELPVYDKEWE